MASANAAGHRADAGDDELSYRKAVRETLLRGAASSRLALYHHVVRRQVAPAETASPEDPFCAALDTAWKARLGQRRLYVNELYLTLVSRPLQGTAGFIEGLFGRRIDRRATTERDLRQLHATRGQKRSRVIIRSKNRGSRTQPT